MTKRNVQSLIGNNTLASVANWADQIRPERDETYNWHFVDIPEDAHGFSDARDCYRPQDGTRAQETTTKTAWWTGSSTSSGCWVTRTPLARTASKR